jgi:16S rRNA (cytidine1402-2'-O)-methyltransferase
MNSKTGRLFVVATPIGNLGDMSDRAVTVLSKVALILAEDTRHAAKLLSNFSVSTRVKSFHDHNEQQLTGEIIELLHGGAEIALISDAGTPLISDPGFRLIRQAREEGIAISPIPGASAVIAALSASGQATDRFCFEGFLPAKSQQRIRRLEELRYEPRTMVFYESSHRIIDSLNAMAEIFGQDREATVAREITKMFETFYFGSFRDIITRINQDPNQQKGEFVIIVSANDAANSDRDGAMRLLQSLIDKVPVKTACRITAETFGMNRNELYKAALALKET